jgi:hypothetical protein
MRILARTNFDFPSLRALQITHVISTPDEVKAGPFKLKRAVESGAKIVSEQYVLDSVKAGKALDDASYVLSAATAEKKVRLFHILIHHTF